MPFRYPLLVLPRSPRAQCRQAALAVLALVLAAACWLATPALADSIPVRAAELRIEEGELEVGRAELASRGR